MEKQKSFTEVVNTEKQIFALIHSKGISDNDVLELYRKTRTGYEETLLSSDQMVERQEVEYHLWRLHYELIDEFRKRIRKRSHNPDNINPESDPEKGLREFKSFLSEANEFYMKLIVKLRKSCGLAEEIFLDNKDRGLSSVEPQKMDVCEHTCHRLLICLGDLARYAEIVKKPDACDWSTSAKYYLEATRTWPDSGNSHNQLALLATYVGDAFLALYHCVRSLAVKEPFPDAWRNIMLLFEENRSTKLPSLCSQMQLDLLNPSKKCYSPQNGISEDLANVCSEKFDLWPLLVRIISLLLVKTSLEEFPCTLASTLHCLEALLAVDDTKLTTSLESYQRMDSSRRGPYRAIQLVTIFIFVVHSLTESQEREDSTGKDDQKPSALKPLAFAAIFICMGRLTERCLKGKNTDICPLLPAVLVFLEWLVGALDTLETHDSDETVKNASSYFFDALADLLDRIEQIGNKTAFDDTALWEDHELRGFYPLTFVHEKLDFTTHQECMVKYNIRNQSRYERIFQASTRIREMSKSFRHTTNFLDQAEVKEHNQKMETSQPKKTEYQPEKIESQPSPDSEPTTEDEEVILFKPITRRNSEPVYISKPKPDPICPNSTKTQGAHADEWLRRATSLSAGHNNEDSDSFTFHSTPTNSGQNRSAKSKEPLAKDSTMSPTGPPSLSAWFGISNIEKDKEKDKGINGLNDLHKHKLSTIDEMASTSLVDLIIDENNSPIIHESPPRATPLPSAPLLHDDAVWLRASSSFSPAYKNEPDGILGAPPIASSYTRGPTIRPTIGFVDSYPPFLGMSSSEWLYHYRNSHNMATDHLPPIHINAPSFVNFHPNELSSFDLCDQWGNHFVSNPTVYMGAPQLYPSSAMAYGGEEQKRDKMFLGYQRPFPYVCGVGMEMSSEQPPLLHYLKEKERQLQPGSQLRGPTFMGN